MNPVLPKAGWHAIAWSDVGDPRASDDQIMDWARQHEHIILTHDLDFTTALALSGGKGPGIVQIRSRNVFPERASKELLQALTLFE